ncbi:MAG TPA: histidine phosphatase family protein [Thermoleophilaceae bacterium]
MAESYPQRGFQLPPDATDVLLIRHGASAAAVPGEPFELVEGQADPPLAPEGEKQAAKLAEWLNDEPLSALFVTPLQRTSQTAAPLAGQKGLVPKVIPELREIMLGDWEGGEFRIRVANGDPLTIRLFEEERWDVIPGAESMESFATRLNAGLEQVADEIGPGNTGAAILHGGVITEICHQLTGSRPFAFLQVDNTSITRVVRRSDGRWLLRYFNETAHLR